MDHGVISGMSVVIGGNAEQYGVLGVHSTQARRYSAGEVDFLQAVADLLRSVVRREAAEAAAARYAQSVIEERANTERVLEAIPSILIFVSPDGRVERWNGAAEDVLGEDSDSKGLITVRSYVDGDTAVVEIGDTGCGIPEAIRGYVFDPFNTTKEVGRGTGQGLTIARSVVVNQHSGGSIDFTSECGVGTTFTIRLPIAPAD